MASPPQKTPGELVERAKELSLKTAAAKDSAHFNEILTREYLDARAAGDSHEADLILALSAISQAAIAKTPQSIINMPMNPNPDPERSKLPSFQDAEKWIGAIGFGAYILAGIGMLAYAAMFRKAGADFNDLKSLIVGTIVVGVILWILTFVNAQLKNFKLNDNAKSVLGIIILVLFAVILCGGVYWLVKNIIWDSPSAPPTTTLRDEYKTDVINTHLTNKQKIEQIISTNPKSKSEIEPLQKDAELKFNQVVSTIEKGQETSTSKLRPQYNKILDDIKSKAPGFEPTYLGNIPEFQKKKFINGPPDSA